MKRGIVESKSTKKGFTKDLLKLAGGLFVGGLALIVAADETTKKVLDKKEEKEDE